MRQHLDWQVLDFYESPFQLTSWLKHAMPNTYLHSSWYLEGNSMRLSRTTAC